jgi:hypothetical protein
VTDGKPRRDGGPSASKSDGLRAAMTAKLASEHGKACYARAQPHHRVGLRTGQDRPGRLAVHATGLRACAAEWKLLCGTHNLLELWRTTTAATC